jgi:hypothetical protein
MLDHPDLIHPRALRLKRVPQTSARVPRLWPSLPILVQIQLAKQMAQLLSRMMTEGRHADRDKGE